MKKLFLLLVVIAAGAAYWFKYGKEEPVKRVPPPVPVAVAQVATRDMPVMLDVVGRTEAYETVTLKSRLDGQVEAVLFTEGQHVQAGDVLVRLDAGDFKARLQQAEANLARDQAQLAKAHIDVERYQALKTRGFVSEEKVSDMRTSEAAIEATLRADKAAVELARLQLGYTNIRAPFSGIVGAKLVFPGAGLKFNDTSLAVVNRIRPLYVTFTAPEKHLTRLKAAMKAGAMKVTVSVPGEGQARFEGEAKFIDNAVDAATGTIQIKAVLANQEEKLTPGQFVKVSLVMDRVNNALVVPTEAVQQGPEGNFVYVVKSDGKAETRKIVLSFTREGLAVIDKGLQEGETVVTDGQLRLTPGVKVQAKEPKAKASGNEPGKAPESGKAPAAVPTPR